MWYPTGLCQRATLAGGDNQFLVHIDDPGGACFFCLVSLAWTANNGISIDAWVYRQRNPKLETESDPIHHSAPMTQSCIRQTHREPDANKKRWGMY